MCVIRGGKKIEERVKKSGQLVFRQGQKWEVFGQDEKSVRRHCGRMMPDIRQKAIEQKWNYVRVLQRRKQE